MDREKVIKELRDARRYLEDKEWSDRCASPHIDAINDALELLKEQESLLGIQQTADGITFISTGTAQQGEERGILLGKSLMHEWIYKELLHKGLLTDDIRSVFEQAKRI